MDRTDLHEIAERERRARKPIRILCCSSTGCQSGPGLLQQALAEAVSAAGLDDRIEVVSVGCLRLCGSGPLVAVEPAGVLLEHVAPEDAAAVVRAAAGEPSEARACDTGQPFFARQASVVLERSGRIDPERIESSVAEGAYATLEHALHERTPAEIIDAVTRSGLRGRGGAGYPTGLKWATVAKAAGDVKYLICNGDEGDPGAFMDRAVLESDPHRVLEGMALAAYAVGAGQGYLYVRGEYPLAIRRLQIAIRQARHHGLIGGQILGTPFSFNVDVRIGAGAFVCGEETALIASIEGRRGMPRVRPPYPAEHGLWGCPTLVNNVETFACIVPIIRDGPERFAALGTAGSTGTKVFALTGKVRNSGLVEVPMGTTLRTIVEELGGSAPDGAVKAVQTGGPSGGCIPASLLDTPIDYESLAAIGSIMGSGGMVVLDEHTRMVDVARYYMEFCKDESCGKCVPCRVGTAQMHRLLATIGEGGGTPEDVARLEELCDLVRTTSLCGLGQSAPNPVLSTLRFFREEYEALLVGGPHPRPLSLPPERGESAAV